MEILPGVSFHLKAVGVVSDIRVQTLCGVVGNGPLGNRRAVPVRMADHPVAHKSAVGSAADAHPVFINIRAVGQGLIRKLHEISEVIPSESFRDVGVGLSPSVGTSRVGEDHKISVGGQALHLVEKYAAGHSLGTAVDLQHRRIFLSRLIACGMDHIAFHGVSVFALVPERLRSDHLMTVQILIVKAGELLLLSRLYIQGVQLRHGTASHGCHPRPAVFDVEAGDRAFFLRHISNLAPAVHLHQLAAAPLRLQHVEDIFLPTVKHGGSAAVFGVASHGISHREIRKRQIRSLPVIHIYHIKSRVFPHSLVGCPRKEHLFLSHIADMICLKLLIRGEGSSFSGGKIIEVYPRGLRADILIHRAAPRRRLFLRRQIKGNHILIFFRDPLRLPRHPVVDKQGRALSADDPLAVKPEGKFLVDLIVFSPLCLVLSQFFFLILLHPGGEQKLILSHGNQFLRLVGKS